MDIDKATLEGLVDAHGLRWIIAALAEICHDKAEHVQTNWQDKNLARDWTRNAKVFEKTELRVDAL